MSELELAVILVCIISLLIISFIVLHPHVFIRCISFEQQQQQQIINSMTSASSASSSSSVPRSQPERQMTKIPRWREYDTNEIIIVVGPCEEKSWLGFHPKFMN
jgi:hypothetical protein